MSCLPFRRVEFPGGYSGLRLRRAPSLNHHALRHHCERKRISAIIRVETTT